MKGLILLLGFAACAAAEAPPRAAWTIMLFMNATDPGLVCHAVQNIEAIKMSSSNPRVNYLVELGRVLPINGQQCPQDKYPVAATLRFRVGPGLAMTPSNRAVTVVPNADMASAVDLREFAKWGRDNYAADHYMVIVWGHGNGINPYDLLFSYVMSTITGGSLPAPMPPIYSPGPGTGGILSGPSDGRFWSARLYNHEVATELLKVFPSGSLDVLGYDSCLMASLESAYAMRDLAGYYVANETREDYGGWNYARWAAALSHAPNTSPAELARSIVDSFGELPESSDSEISAFNLSEIRAFAHDLSSFSNELIPQLNDPAVRNAVWNARSTCQSFTGKNLVDVGKFLTALSGQPGAPPWLLSRSSDLLTSLTTRLIASAWANGTARTQNGASGSSIYFPPEASNGCIPQDPTDGNAYYRFTCTDPLWRSKSVDFVCDEQWATFLYSYLGIANGGDACPRQ
jgi:hypothetical protein